MNRKLRTANTGFVFGEVTCKIGFCASIQVQCWQTVLCSETRHFAKPRNVTSNTMTDYELKNIDSEDIEDLPVEVEKPFGISFVGYGLNLAIV